MMDAQRALTRALALRWPALTVREARSEPWASVTFTGERHVLTVAPGVDLTGLEDAEFDLRGHIVADIAVEVNAAGTTIHALTLHLG